MVTGLQSTPLLKAGFLQRLLGRQPKKNAFIEITNLLAEHPIESVSMPQIADILKRHDLGFQDSRKHFLSIFRTVLAHAADDRELSDQDRKDLAHLQKILKLADKDTGPIREEVLADLYSKSLADALGDEHMSPEERSRLDVIAVSFDLPEERRQDIYKVQVTRLLQLAFGQVISDHRITSGEEARLRAMTENLGVTITHDAETQALMERFRLLARIEEGNLPVLAPEIKLQRGETCHAFFACTQSEIRTHTKSIRYSGPTASIRIMKGVRWRIGQVAVERVTRDVLTQLDAGMLYVTNKRLLFDGHRKNSVINLTKVVRFTLFRDGIRIEKDSGRDQYFIGDADLEVVGTVLERVLSNSR
jgi:hypothetical protein